MKTLMLKITEEILNTFLQIWVEKKQHFLSFHFV